MWTTTKELKRLDSRSKRAGLCSLHAGAVRKADAPEEGNRRGNAGPQEGRHRLLRAICTAFITLNGHYGVGIFRDTTARKQAQEKLRLHEDEQMVLLEKRTNELKRMNEQLIQEIPDRKRIEEELVKRHPKENRREGIETVPG